MDTIRPLWTVFVTLTWVILLLHPSPVSVHSASSTNIIQSPIHTPSSNRLLYFIAPTCDEPLQQYAAEESFVGFHVTDDLSGLIQQDRERIGQGFSGIPETACVKQAQVRLGSSMIPSEWPEAFPLVRGLVELVVLGFESIQFDDHNFIVYAPVQLESVEKVSNELLEAAKSNNTEIDLESPKPTPVVVVETTARLIQKEERTEPPQLPYHPMRRTMDRFAVLEQSQSMQNHLRRNVHITSDCPATAPTNGNLGTCSASQPASTSCTYNCNGGYGLTSGNVCGSGGTWTTGPGSCSLCSAGTCSRGNASACNVCPAGSYCLSGASGATACPVGTYSAAGSGSCTTCPAGYYTLWTSATNCAACGPGDYCTGGSAINACAPGTYGPFTANNLTSQSDCTNCPVGWYCTGGVDVTICPEGSYCPANSSIPTSCPPGSYSSTAGQSSCTSCPIGSSCSGGSSIVIWTLRFLSVNNHRFVIE